MFRRRSRASGSGGPEEPREPSWALFRAQLIHHFKWSVTTTDGVSSLIRWAMVLLVGFVAIGFYAQGKAHQEEVCAAFNETYGLKGTVWGTERVSD